MSIPLLSLLSKALHCYSTNNDAIWSVVMVLGHYLTLYEKIPTLIEEAAATTLDVFRATAETTHEAAAESAKADLAKAVATSAQQVARDVAGKQRVQWQMLMVALCLFCFSALSLLMYSLGSDAGQKRGYVTGYEIAKDEKAAASFAATPYGQRAYKLARQTDITPIARCSRPGWVIEEGMCYPHAAKERVK